MKPALKEYREKVQLGLVPKPERLDPIEKAKRNPTSFRFAIRAKCFECSGFERIEVTNCEFDYCPLYKHRPWQK